MVGVFQLYLQRRGQSAAVCGLCPVVYMCFQVLCFVMMTCITLYVMYVLLSCSTLCAAAGIRCVAGSSQACAAVCVSLHSSTVNSVAARSPLQGHCVVGVAGASWAIAGSFVDQSHPPNMVAAA